MRGEIVAAVERIIEEMLTAVMENLIYKKMVLDGRESNIQCVFT
jgi:hypothetical protein